MQKAETTQCRLLRIAVAVGDKGILCLLEDQFVRFAVRTGIEIDCAKIGLDFDALKEVFQKCDLCILGFPFLEANKDLLERLYLKNPDCLPVFLDVPAERICQYLALRPGGYLQRKGLTNGGEDLTQLCLACARRISNSGRVLQFVTRQGIEAVSLRSILFCQSDLKYVVIVSEDGTRLRKPGKLNDLAALLSDDFVRIHQSFLINRGRVRAVRKDSHELLLDQGVRVPYSRAYQEIVLRLFDGTGGRKTSSDS